MSIPFKVIAIVYLSKKEYKQISIYMKAYFQKHSTYFTGVWYTALFISFPLALIDQLIKLFQTAHDGNLLGFIINLVFLSFLVMVSGFIGAIILFILIVIITIVPYLIIRGIKN